MNWRKPPPTKGTAKPCISLIERQDRRVQRTDMNDIVAFTRERFRHVKWGSGPEPHLACIADRGECDPPPCMVIESLVVVLIYSLTKKRNSADCRKRRRSKFRKCGR